MKLYTVSILYLCTLLNHCSPQGISYRSGSTLTTLMDALNDERYDIARNMIEEQIRLSGGAKCWTKSPDVNYKASGGTTLYYAVGKEVITDARFEIIKLLLEHCADPNITNVHKWTPLMQASRYGNARVVKLLLENGANTNMRRDEDRTALHEAVFWGHVDAAKVLIEHAANVNAQDRYKFTPLHFASSNGTHDLVKLLLQHGADRNAKNSDGNSAYDLAKQRGNTIIIDLFESANESSNESANKSTNKSTMLQKIENECHSFPIDHIYNGELARDGEFPWMAALGYISERGYRLSFDCGGTIISNSFVLTAAHCVKLRQPSIVRMGKLSLIDVNEEDEFSTVSRHIEDIIPHPDHSWLTKRHDIALLRLKRTIPFSANIRPACLQTDTRDEPADVELIVTGWGVTSRNSTGSSTLRKAHLTTMPFSQCNRTLTDWGIPRRHPALRDGLIDGQYCAYDPQGRNVSCEGDSGGLLVRLFRQRKYRHSRDEGGPLQFFPTRESNVATVVGIISFGIGKGCPLNFPSVNTRVAHYIDWIQPIVWPEL